MGRRAKYRTLGERLAAKREQQKKYTQSARGRARRAIQNKKTYSARTGLYPSPFHHTIHGLPSEIITLARRAFQVGSPLQHSYDLGIWTQPFALQIPDELKKIPEADELFDDDQYDEDELASGLHIANLERLIEAGWMRLERWSDESEKEALLVEMNDEIVQRLEAWQRRAGEEDRHGSLLADVAHSVGIEWSAKILCCLKVEQQIGIAGSEEIERAWRAGQLPWQCKAADEIQ
ncbi:uncharacterized protein LAESUDRAFT_754695 [Laetiporus sulphureus 93-53]|uniref:Uncharacterized protein n=1 Tax=Laetiporus sulphureus 93-53 TaxID=1314785 RepID=A0A165HUF2_9APHY|nr:uncharacterized protein LAESUDRAFT_754695 [Laetiporus sulphureus 93-53]KZT12201.1 hypothetical protein LAESUDRAFT_754695 [Laetiporus sulphureus 93-53]